MMSNWIGLKCSLFTSQPKNEKTIHSKDTRQAMRVRWNGYLDQHPLNSLKHKRELLYKAKCVSEAIQVIRHITPQMILVISRTSFMIVSKCFVRIIYNKLMYRIEGNVLCKRCAHGELIAILHASLDFNIGRHIDQISKWNRWGKYLLSIGTASNVSFPFPFSAEPEWVWCVFQFHYHIYIVGREAMG